MKLILVLLVLISRELVTPAWRNLLTKPSYWWRDLWLNVASKQNLSASLVLAALSLLPVMIYGVLFLFFVIKNFRVGFYRRWKFFSLVGEIAALSDEFAHFYSPIFVRF